MSIEKNSLLKSSDVQSHIKTTRGDLVNVFDVQYHIDGYHVLLYYPKLTSYYQSTLEWKLLFLQGSYRILQMQDFSDVTGLTVENITLYLSDDATLSGLPYILGVNQENRVYTDVFDDFMRKDKISEVSYQGAIYESMHLENEQYVITLDTSDGELYNALTNLGIPAAIAFKITVSLTGYENTVELLDSFMSSGMSFRYDESTRLSLFEIYVYFCQYFSSELTAQIMEAHNFSMQYLTMLWIVLRRGGENVITKQIKTSIHKLDSRAAGALLTMMERGMLKDYTTSNAILQVLNEVDWDILLASIDEYTLRLQRDGLSRSIQLNFSLSQNSSQVATYYAEAQEAFMQIGYADGEFSKAYTSKVQSERTSELLLNTYLPLIAHFADNNTIRENMQRIVAYQQEQNLPPLPIESLYTSLYWYNQGGQDLPTAWILSEYTAQDESWL